MSSSVAKSASVAIPNRKLAADDSIVGSYGATAPHPRIRRTSGGDERGYDDRNFNPYRVVVGSAGSPACALALANTNNLNKAGNGSFFGFDPSVRQVKTGRALINPFDPSVFKQKQKLVIKLYKITSISIKEGYN